MVIFKLHFKCHVREAATGSELGGVTLRGCWFWRARTTAGPTRSPLPRAAGLKPLTQATDSTTLRGQHPVTRGGGPGTAGRWLDPASKLPRHTSGQVLPEGIRADDTPLRTKGAL